jgi:hypothetical protein
MDGNQYLQGLCDLATAAGAKVTVELDEKALAEGRRAIRRVTVSGVPGIGPHPMATIAATERLCLAKSQGHFGPVIVSAEISPMPRPMPAGMLDPMPSVFAKFSNGQARRLFEFYPDEISFEPMEFIGLTQTEAMQLKAGKDRNFLLDKEGDTSSMPAAKPAAD